MDRQVDFRRLNREDFSRPELIDPIYFNGEVDLWAGNSQLNSQEAWNLHPSRKQLPTIEEEARTYELSLPAGEKEVHVSYLLLICISSLTLCATVC